MLRILALGLAMAGCAVPAALPSGADSAAPEAPALAVSLAPLAPAPSPELPLALRAPGPSTVTTAAAMDHGAHAHGDHAAHDGPAPVLGPLTDALDAYLDAHEALAADDPAPVPALASAFAGAWAEAVETAPEADPHFWHARAEEVGAVRTHALALAAAADLDAAREAFGHLSAALVGLVEARGAPAGLWRFTCGMRSDLPEGGVWLQRGPEPRNPYFGSAMLACATDRAALPARTGDLATPEAAPGAGASGDHGAVEHAGHSGDHR